MENTTQQNAENLKVDAEVEHGNKEKIIQTSYPSEPIFPSIALVKQVVTSKGEINPISKKDISIITDKAEATLGMKLSTCVQYGLLTLAFGKGYLPGKNYHKYTYEEQANALLLIFSSPPLYSKLIADLNGKMLPNETDFAIHLKNNYNLNPNSSEKAAKIFLENARNLNLIDSNNRLKFILKEQGADLGNKTENPIGDEPPPNFQQQPINTDLLKLPIKLPVGKGDDDRFAYFEYPKTLNKRDFKVIAKALTFVASSVIIDEADEDYELLVKVEETKNGSK
jgi:hypothetical protein